MDALNKPCKLSPGDTIAAISLSWGGAALFPYRYEIGKKRLEEVFQLNVVPTKHALKDPEWLYRNPKARADDLMQAFQDPNINAIFSIIGGDDSIRLLPYVDFNIIKNNPKIFLGLSDSTITHFMCLQAELGSFYGPAIMMAFAENVEMHRYTIDSLRNILFETTSPVTLYPNDQGFTAEFLDWANPENQFIQRKLVKSPPWQFISGSQKSVGRLLGGCIDTFPFMQGTDVWPKASIWKDTILFLETSEEGITPLQFERLLRNLGSQGILAKVNGLLFSKPGGADINPNDFHLYDQTILKILKEFEIENLPVVTNMDFGHTDPMLTLPIGVLCEVDAIKKSITLLEAACRVD